MIFFVMGYRLIFCYLEFHQDTFDVHVCCIVVVTSKVDETISLTLKMIMEQEHVIQVISLQQDEDEVTD